MAHGVEPDGQTVDAMVEAGTFVGAREALLLGGDVLALGGALAAQGEAGGVGPQAAAQRLEGDDLIGRCGRGSRSSVEIGRPRSTR